MVGDAMTDMIINAPGVHDIPAELYHRDPVVQPSLSNSIAKLLLNECPLEAAAHHPKLAIEPIKEEKDSFDLGSAAHTLLLGDGRAFEIVDKDSWRGNIDGMKSADFKSEARRAGKIPILRKDFDQTVMMAEACRAQLREHEVGDLLATGKGEQTIVWQEGDVWCHALIDWLSEVIEEGMTVLDYKTTKASAHPALWGMRTGPAIGFDFQDAFYNRGIRQVFKVKKFRFLFLVQRRRPPWLISVIEIKDDSRRQAMNYVQDAVRTWRSCMREGHWPGYPGEVIQVSPRSRITPDIEEFESGYV